MTNRLTLRPVSEDDLPLLQTLTQDPEATGEFGWIPLGLIVPASHRHDQAPAWA